MVASITFAAASDLGVRPDANVEEALALVEDLLASEDGTSEAELAGAAEDLPFCMKINLKKLQLAVCAGKSCVCNPV